MAAAVSPSAIQDLNEDMTQFAPVVASIRFDRLAHFAMSIRERQRFPHGPDVATPGIANTSPTMCEVLQPPLFGSYHIVYVLRFEDGVRWVFKVPATGYRDRYDESAARALTSEALTMGLLARETTVPVPKVYHFDSSLDNELHCPFIMMEYINGMPCSDCWFDSSIDKALLEQRRARTLADVAKAMAQLGKFAYNLGGAPLFDEDGSPDGVGPIRIPDFHAVLERARTDDTDESPIFCEAGPFTNPIAFILCMLDRREAPPDFYSQGFYKLLRLFIRWLPQDTREPGFVLTHPDLDIQNVIVTEDGALAGLIDWDGVAALPRCLGNERYPSWLTRDWDPAKYAYGRTPRDGREAFRENSPKELARYRSMYLSTLGACMPGEGKRGVTGRSLLTDNLQIAADDPICTPVIVEKVFEECMRAWQSLSPEREGAEGGNEEDEDIVDEDLFLYDLFTNLVDGDFDQARLGKIKQGFDALCASLDGLGASANQEDAGERQGT